MLYGKLRGDKIEVEVVAPTPGMPDFLVLRGNSLDVFSNFVPNSINNNGDAFVSVDAWCDNGERYKYIAGQSGSTGTTLHHSKQCGVGRINIQAPNVKPGLYRVIIDNRRTNTSHQCCCGEARVTIWFKLFECEFTGELGAIAFDCVFCPTANCDCELTNGFCGYSCVAPYKFADNGGWYFDMCEYDPWSYVCTETWFCLCNCDCDE